MNLFQDLKERKILDKDGKVDALGPYGKQKLTGKEVSQYFKKNKVKDPEIRKAVEVALDLGGAMDIAGKEIQKFFGRKIRNSKEVKKALKYANESYEAQQTLDNLDEARAMKLKQIAKKYKKELVKAEKQGIPEMDTPLYIAIWKRAWEDGEIRNDDPDHSDEVVGEYIDEILGEFFKESIDVINGVLTEASAFEIMQDIVKDKQAKKIKGTMVDMFTASVVVKAYEKVNDSNKKKIEKAPLEKLVQLAHKVMGMKEEAQLDEVTEREIKQMKKLSKDMQSVLKGYQNIAKLGDKELKNPKHNPSYEKVLAARDAILTMIGTLNTQMLLTKEENELLDEWISKDGARRRVAEKDQRKVTEKKDPMDIPHKAQDIAKKMMKSRTMKGFASKVKKMKKVTHNDLEKMLPDYISGGDINALFNEESISEGDKSLGADKFQKPLKKKKYPYQENLNVMDSFRNMVNQLNEAPALPSVQSGDIDLDKTDHSIEAGVANYVVTINKQIKTGEFAKLHKDKQTEIRAKKASKYYRVETWEHGRVASIHAFIEIKTGDIFKPAGFKAPAKGARGNVTDNRYIDFVAKYPRAYHGGHLYK